MHEVQQSTEQDKKEKTTMVTRGTATEYFMLTIN
jgi:hypothetical protein